MAGEDVVGADAGADASNVQDRFASRRIRGVVGERNGSAGLCDRRPEIVNKEVATGRDRQGQSREVEGAARQVDRVESRCQRLRASVGHCRAAESNSAAKCVWSCRRTGTSDKREVATLLVNPGVDCGT